MTVRARLRLTSVTDTNWGGSLTQKKLRFDAIYDTATPEGQRFQKATPSGHCELQIDNPQAIAQFEIGKDYYVDFNPVPVPETEAG